MPEGEDPEQPRRVAAPVRTVRAGIVVGCFVIGLLLLLGPAADLRAGAPPTTRPKPPPALPVVRSKTRVQVVNATVTQGAAAMFQHQLNSAGWNSLTAEDLSVPVTRATQQRITFVYFLPRHQPAAQMVATELHVPATHVLLRTRSVLNEVHGAYRDDVVVLLGTDLAH